MSNRGCAGVAAVIIAFIVYGSLFPFHFRDPTAGLGPLTTLLQTWIPEFKHIGNLLANILLYMPLGFFGVLAIPHTAGNRARFASVFVFGGALCFAVELTQYYDAGRIPQFADIYSNALGTAIGALGGLVFGLDFRWPLLREARANPLPVFLLAAWLGYRLFPYAPDIDLHKYWQALKPVFLHPQLSLYAVARYGVMWLTVGAIIQALVGGRRSRFLFPLMIVFVFGAKVAIATKVLTLSEVVGAPLALAVWLMLARRRLAARHIVIALMLAVFIVVERLQPFQFQVAGGHFGWIPFASFMRGSMYLNAQSFLEKFFLYASLIWLLSVAGLRLSVAAILVALGLFITSVVETHLPGRSAEVTDALMALIIAGLFSLLSAAPRARRHHAATPPAPRPEP